MQYSLSDMDLKLCKSKKTKKNCLAFGVMLSYFKIHAKFPSRDNLPCKMLFDIASDLDISSAHIDEFSWNSRTAERYYKEIRKYFGYRVSNGEDTQSLMTYLINDLISKDTSDVLISEYACAYLAGQKIEVINDKQLEHCISAAKLKFEQQLFQKIFDCLSKQDCVLIDEVLEGRNVIDLSELKQDIAGARIKNITSAIDRINLLSKINLPEFLANSVDRKILLKYYERIIAVFPSNILEFSEVTKYANMAIFFHIRLELMLDSLVDLMIKLIRRTRTSAEKYVEKHILHDIRRVGGKYDILATLAALNANNPKGIIEDEIYPVISKDKLEDVIIDLNNSGGKWYQNQVQTKMHSTYAHGSRVNLLAIMKTLNLSVDHEDHRPILDALDFINKYSDESDLAHYINKPKVSGVIPQNWYHMVVESENGLVNKYNYEIAVFERLVELLIVKSVWVKRSYRYRDPSKDLLSDFDENYTAYCKLLNLPLNGKDFTATLKDETIEALKNLNTDIPNNIFVSIKERKNGSNIKVTPNLAQEEPTNITKLQQEISSEYSTIHLLDVLKECDLRINFIQELQTIGKMSNIEFSDLQKRLLLCIFAIGSNTGLKRISIANEDVSYSDLCYVKQRYINAVNIRNVIRIVINKVLEARDPDVWGNATTTIACDSTHLFSWDQNLMSEWHFRYHKKGVMIYWHIDKKSLCIYSQLKDCTSSEVGSMLKGFLDHDTEMDVKKIFVDTHGQSVIGFAISSILGFSLCPRLKAINKQKLFYADFGDKEKYKNIEPILKSCINWQIIEENYKEVIRHIAALKLGKVSASVLIKRFSQGNFSHPVYKALIEIGKANKTIFLCKFLCSKELRTEIGEGLNVVERLNSVMDFIFYGKLGQISTNNIADQELSVLCLHLLQVCMVYINTLMIQKILSRPHWYNRFTEEDYRALTPLFSGHINPYGLFLLDLNKRIMNI